MFKKLDLPGEENRGMVCADKMRTDTGVRERQLRTVVAFVSKLTILLS
jgi:hypothetical protein